MYTVGPVFFEFFRVEIGQFKTSSDKFVNDSVRFKKVQSKIFMANQKAILNLKKPTSIQSMLFVGMFCYSKKVVHHFANVV